MLAAVKTRPCGQERGHRAVEDIAPEQTRERSATRATLAHTPEAWLGAILLALAAISGTRPEDDSLQHYARSLVQVWGLQFDTWITDVWNKPLTGLAFGLAGGAGLFGARALSVGISVYTAHLTARLCEHLLPNWARPSRALSLCVFMAQMAVLKDAFVTMTELPAAMFLALALFLHVVRQRPRAAALAAGFAPLCRVEVAPLVAWLGIWIAVGCWRTKEADVTPPVRARIRETAAPLLLAGLPFAAWLGLGAIVHSDPMWFSQESYAQLRRAWDAPAVLRHNVLTGLASVAPPPMLLAFILGLAPMGGVTDPQSGSARERLHHGLLLGLLAIHYFLLNSLVVFPDDFHGVAPGHAVAAINARNYTPTAPILVFFTLRGLSRWLAPLAGGRAPGWGPIVTACALVAFAVTLAKWGSPADLGLHWALLGLSAVGGAFVVRRARASSQPEQPAQTSCQRPLRRAVLVCVLGCVLACIVIRPFFWYPSPINDRKDAAIRHLADVLRRTQPPRVVQDLASALVLDDTLRASDLDVTWSWPSAYPARLRDAPSGTVVVVQTDLEGVPHSRYPRSVLERLAQPAQFEPIATYRSPPQPRWLDTVDRIAARNRPVAFVAYRLR